MYQIVRTVVERFKKLALYVDKLAKNKNVILFLFFLILASTFWFLNSLQQEYTTNIYYPIRFTNLPDNKLVSGEIPKNIVLKVRGSGYSLMRYNFSNKIFPLELEVNRMRRFSSGEKRGAYLLTEHYSDRVSGQLYNDIELLEMSPDTFFIGLQNRKKRLLPVRLNVDINYLESYFQSASIIIEPEYIEVSGPDLIVDTLKYVSTQHIVFQSVNDSIVRNISLASSDNIEYDVDDVKITVPVESFTESKLKVPIAVSGLPQGLTIKTFPSEVDVSCLVAISQFENVQKQQFFAHIDVSDLDLANQSRLKVKMETVPDFVYSVKYEPLFVEFIIERSYK